VLIKIRDFTIPEVTQTGEGERRHRRGQRKHRVGSRFPSGGGVAPPRAV